LGWQAGPENIRQKSAKAYPLYDVTHKKTHTQN